MLQRLSRLVNGGGVKVPHHKDTANFPTEYLPVPPKVILPMNQHVGAPCEPCVKKGRQGLGRYYGGPGNG